jgi:hypothetical protein
LGSGGIAPRILWPQHYMEVSGQLHAPSALPPRERPTRTHWIGGWVSPRAGWARCRREKFPAPAEIRIPIIQRSSP